MLSLYLKDIFKVIDWIKPLIIIQVPKITVHKIATTLL